MTRERLSLPAAALGCWTAPAFLRVAHARRAWRRGFAFVEMATATNALAGTEMMARVAGFERAGQTRASGCAGTAPSSIAARAARQMRWQTSASPQIQPLASIALPNLLRVSGSVSAAIAATTRQASTSRVENAGQYRSQACSADSHPLCPEIPSGIVSVHPRGDGLARRARMPSTCSPTR